MSDDFGTVNVRPGARTSEFDALRRRYARHREALEQMAAEAPTEALAAEYQRLLATIDSSVRKLDELEGRPAAAAASSPGNRPLVLPADTETYEPPAVTPAGGGSRIVLIVLAGLIVLGALGWLIWRASSDRKPATPAAVVETTATEPAATPVPVPAPAPTAASIKVTPAVQDYGIIRKGTRAVRQFELTNNGATPITISVARSSCRCLFYDYNGKPVAPNAHETITVTVDAARARGPAVDEQIAVTAKEDPSATATIGVKAEIR